jgi:hypothetical protein
MHGAAPLSACIACSNKAVWEELNVPAGTKASDEVAAADLAAANTSSVYTARVSIGGSGVVSDVFPGVLKHAPGIVRNKFGKSCLG